jgi:ankyrin repeat protein
MLVERGADVTAQNNDGSTPLNPATRKGQVDAARLFIERGVDVTAQNDNNSRETPTTITSSVNSIIFHPDVSSEYAARILLKYGVHVNAQNKNSDSTSSGTAGKLAEIERVFIRHGADFGAHDNMNQIPFCGV